MNYESLLVFVRKAFRRKPQLSDTEGKTQSEKSSVVRVRDSLLQETRIRLAGSKANSIETEWSMTKANLRQDVTINGNCFQD